LVTTPEAVVFAEARRTLTSLALYGYRVDGIVVNRIFPAAGADDWRAKWIAAQAIQLARIEADCDPVPVFKAGYEAAEPVGPQALAALVTQVYGDGDPIAVHQVPEPLSISRRGSDFELAIALPLVAKGEIDVARRSDELMVTVGAHRRVLSLPSALRRCEIRGAHLEPGRLLIDFTPDPKQFPRKA
jgi:arsenite-transporting ATPase